MNNFSEKVRKVVRSIPEGQALSYKEVARRAGSPLAYRAVGSVMRKNHDSYIPCHRVVKSNGEPGGYNGGEIEKELRLIAEDAVFDNHRQIKYTITSKFGGVN